VRFTALALFSIAMVAAEAQEGERAPFVTTPDEVVTQMLRFAGTGPADLVIDLGSGDGRIPIAAAREFGARAIGIELDAALVASSRQEARRAEVEDRVAFVQGDVLLADFSRASVVTVYLLPSLINRLQPRLLDELAPGTRVVSHAFAMTGWTADRSLTVRLDRRHEGQGDESTLHLWLVPAKVRGVWRERVAPGGRPAWRFQVTQNFQQIEIEAQAGGKPFGIARASLAGRDIAWESSNARFNGRVRGNRMTGQLTHGGIATRLELTRDP
jgi:precorrin-6B methylase 2